MIYDIISLINDGAITVDDLESFSDELKETATVFLERQSWDYSDDAQSQVGKVGETQIAEIRGSWPR